jgi:hypothetical protein
LTALEQVQVKKKKKRPFSFDCSRAGASLKEKTAHFLTLSAILTPEF